MDAFQGWAEVLLKMVQLIINLGATSHIFANRQPQNRLELKMMTSCGCVIMMVVMVVVVVVTIVWGLFLVEALGSSLLGKSMFNDMFNEVKE